METRRLPAKLIETGALQSLVTEGVSNLRVLETSFVMNPAAANASEQFSEGHIPGSVLFDLKEISNKETGLNASFPSNDVWIEFCK